MPRPLSATAFAIALLFCAACNLESTPATATPYASTAPPAPIPAPSPTPFIKSSEELYADEEGIGRTDPRFASLPVDAVLPPLPIGESARHVKIVLGDGVVITGERFGFGILRQPGVLLLSEEAEDWGALPRQLEGSGFIVLALNARSSLKTRHIETVLRSMLAIDTLDGGRIAIVGAGRSADLALVACAVNALCRMAGLLSPLSRDSLLNMMGGYAARPLWLAAAADDSEAHATAAALSEAARGEVVFHETQTGRGADLLRNHPDLADELVDWLKAKIGD